MYYLHAPNGKYANGDFETIDNLAIDLYGVIGGVV